jgi:hypothetical protein
MKLEDFLTQRTNYVDPNASRRNIITSEEYPVASADEMKEHFKKMREIQKQVKKTPQPTKPAEKIVVKEEIPVVAPGVDRVSTQQAAAAPQVIPTLPPVDDVPPSIVEREEKIEELMRNPAASGGDESNLWYFLPAALGALTGNLGEGAAASAGAIGEARKRGQQLEDYNLKLDAKLRELALQRQQGRAGSFQIKYLENPETGEVEAYNYDTQTGERFPLGMKAGFAKQIVKNPLTDEFEVVSKADGQSKQFQSAQRTTAQKIEPNSIKGIATVKDFEKEVQKDPDYVKHTGTISSAKQLSLYVSRNRKLDAQAIGPALTFLFEGPQRLTDEDVKRYRLPEGFANRLDEYIQMGLGKEGLTPQYQYELAGMLEDLAAKASYEGQDVLSSKTKDFQSNYGFDPTDKLSNLYRPFKSQDLKKSLSGTRPISMGIAAPAEKDLRGRETKSAPKTESKQKSYSEMSTKELEELARKRGLK